MFVKNFTNLLKKQKLNSYQPNYNPLVGLWKQQLFMWYCVACNYNLYFENNFMIFIKLNKLVLGTSLLLPESKYQYHWTPSKLAYAAPMWFMIPFKCFLYIKQQATSLSIEFGMVSFKSLFFKINGEI